MLLSIKLSLRLTANCRHFWLDFYFGNWLRLWVWARN